MKITKIGWVGKTMPNPEIWIDSNDGQFMVNGIFKKGKKDNWISEDWPPRKVRITVEDAD